MRLSFAFHDLVEDLQQTPHQRHLFRLGNHWQLGDEGWNVHNFKYRLC